MKITRLPIICSLALALATPSFAAISLIDSGSFATNADASSYTITAADLGGALDFSGASKLVVTTGSEAAPNNQGHTPTSVTYGGVPLTLAISEAGGQGRATIWYLDLGASFSGTDFVISYGETQVQNGIGLGAYVLGNTLPGVADTFNSGGSSTVSVTTTTANEFAILSYARNNTNFVSFDGVTELYRHSGDGWSAASAYASLGAPGTYPLTIDQNNNSGRIVAATFAAIPEPSTALLGGLGLLALLRRRR